jgi:hypothetical protein
VNVNAYLPASCTSFRTKWHCHEVVGKLSSPLPREVGVALAFPLAHASLPLSCEKMGLKITPSRNEDRGRHPATCSRASSRGEDRVPRRRPRPAAKTAGLRVVVSLLCPANKSRDDVESRLSHNLMIVTRGGEGNHVVCQSKRNRMNYSG